MKGLGRARRTRRNWSEVLFCLHKNDGRFLVWHRRGERHAKCCTKEAKAYNGGSVMVWAGIHLNGKTRLVFVDGNLNHRRYIDEIVTPVALPCLQQMGPNATLQQDNARPHTARARGQPRWLSGLRRSHVHSLMITRPSLCPEKLGSNPGQGSKGINLSGWHGLDMSITVTKRR